MVSQPSCPNYILCPIALSSGVQKENVNEVLQDSSDEGRETSSRLHDPSESQQPPCSTTLSDEQDVSAPCVAREDPSYKENKAPTVLPGILHTLVFLWQVQAGELKASRVGR